MPVKGWLALGHWREPSSSHLNTYDFRCLQNAVVLLYYHHELALPVYPMSNTEAYKTLKEFEALLERFVIVSIMWSRADAMCNPE